MTGSLGEWPSRDSWQAALAQMACAGKRQTQGQAAGPGGRVTRHQAHGCGEAPPPGCDSLALTWGRGLAAFSLFCRCVPVALQPVPGSSTEEATEPRARWKSRARAQLPTLRPAILRMGRACDPPRGLDKERHLARPAPRAVVGPRVGGQGAGLLWVWRWGPQADGLLCPSCSLACGGIGGTGSPAAPPTVQAGAQAARRPTSARGHAPPLCQSALPVPGTPRKARAPGDLSNQQTAPSWASPVRERPCTGALARSGAPVSLLGSLLPGPRDVCSARDSAILGQQDPSLGPSGSCNRPHPPTVSDPFLVGLGEPYGGGGAFPLLLPTAPPLGD